MYNNYVVVGCGFMFVVAVLIPIVYHVCHLVWRIIDDLEYDVKKHGFFVRFFPKYFNKSENFYSYVEGVTLDYAECVVCLYAVLFAVLFSVAGVAVFPVLLYPISVIGLILGLIYGARGLRRLQKALRKHMNDKEAHR